MAVVVSRNFGPLAEAPLGSRELMREVGLLARELVYRRTIAGRDEHDAPFRPYSEAYAARKAAEVGSAGVNLQLSGGMLNAMEIIELTETSVVLGFRR